MEIIDSLLFDVYKREDFSELEPMAQELFASLPPAARHRETVLKLKRMVRLFLYNLYRSHLNDRAIAVSLRTQNFSKGRYKALHLNYRQFRLVYRHLLDTGFLEVRPGYKGSQFEHGLTTRIWPSLICRERFSGFISIPEATSRDVICVRRKVGEDNIDIVFWETEFTSGLRHEIEFINNGFNRHHFEYRNHGKEETIHYLNPFHKYYLQYKEYLINHHHSIRETGEGSTILIAKRPLRETKPESFRMTPRVRAIFNEGGFRRGGRLYADSPFRENWQGMPGRERRAAIRIDGEAVVELDFSAMHITILYAVCHLPPEANAYDHIAAPEMRPWVKQLMLTALNAESDHEALHSLKDHHFELRGSKLLSERDMTALRLCEENQPDWARVLRSLQRRHHPIRKFFCSGCGVVLQRIDAEIMRRILLRLAEQDIPALPVHDSIIVPESRERQAYEAMDQTFRAQWPEGFGCGIARKKSTPAPG